MTKKTKKFPEIVYINKNKLKLLKKYIEKYLAVKMYDSCDAIVDAMVHEGEVHPTVCIYTSGDPVVTKKQVYDLLQMDVEVLKI